MLGSTLYKLTWKPWVTPSGRSRSRLRASVLRTSETGCIGWPTPAAHEPGGTPEQHLARKRACVERGIQMGATAVTHLSLAVQYAGWPTPTVGNAMGSQSFEGLSATGKTPDGRKVAVSLGHVVTMAGWPTPTKGNADGSQMALDASTTGRRPDGSKATVSLNQVAQQAGWPTPTRQDSASSGAAGYSTESGRHAGTTLTGAARFAGWISLQAADAHGSGINQHTASLCKQVRGVTMSGSPALTEKRGALASTLSRWLMGYPIFWQQCSPTTLPKRRKR